MASEITAVPQGTVTSPQGFLAGATYAGIKKKAAGALDLGILFSETPATAAGVFTTNRIKAAPVVLSQQRLQSGRAQAVVANSGCANACTGEQGLADATEMSALAAEKTGVSQDSVLVASTGVIGQPLPMELIRRGMGQLSLSADGGHELERAIMTTDTVPKEIAVRVGDHFVIGGIAKGAGMIHPDMATMLCFLTSDATVAPDFLQSSVKQAADVSFNMVSVDGDTSTNDTVVIMANGQAGNSPITGKDELAPLFQQALEYVCVSLAKDIARDGEGANRLIEVTVSGAATITDARAAARTIVNSPLVKTAVYGADPNWGRIMAALGRSGAQVKESAVEIFIADTCLVKNGQAQAFNRAAVASILRQPEVSIHLNLNLGKTTATAWGCDLSEEYIAINSHYTT